MWKDIKNYEGLYKVNEKGEIKSLPKYRKHSRVNNYYYTKEKIMHPSFDKDGYLMTRLVKDGKYTVVRVHRIVAETFIPNPNNLPIVNHKDENKCNNCVDNLEWVTQKENVNYGTRTERQIKSQSLQVLQIKDGKVIAEFSSLNEAARSLGKRNGGAISSCVNGITKTAYGYKWMIKE